MIIFFSDILFDGVSGKKMIIFRIVQENDENRNSSYFFNDHLSNFHQIASQNQENS